MRWGHNFVRLWTQEAWLHDLDPPLWERTGPGAALDGGPRYDLTRIHPAFLERLAARVGALDRRGLYASVMLFQGWSIHDNGAGNPWHRHPMHRANNVNGVDGDPARSGHGRAVHSLRLPDIVRLQERFVTAVVDAVGALPNVLYEIANESPAESLEWQEHLVDFLGGLLRERTIQRPIGITCLFPGGRNRDLFRGPADWVAPGPRGGYRAEPPPAKGDKVVLLDTDHLWGIGGDAAWVWRAFLAGYHPVYMDPLDDDPQREAARRAMGAVLRCAAEIDLAAMVPDPKIASSGCALRAGNAGRVVIDPVEESEEIVALAPAAADLRLDLRSAAGAFDATWRLLDGTPLDRRERITGGRRVSLAPAPRGDAVVRLRRAPRTDR